MRYILVFTIIFNFSYGYDLIFNGFGSLTTSTREGIETPRKVYIDQEQEVDSGIDIESGSVFGLQATADLEYFQAIAQGVFRKTYENEIYEPELEWLFFKKDITNELSIRIGRMRIPAFLFSQTIYVDFTRNYAKLPAELYTALPFTNYDGLELSYTKSFNNYVLSGFVGVSEESKYDNIASGGGTLLTGFKINDILIGSLSIENENFMLRGTYIRSKINVDNNQYEAQYNLAKEVFPDIYHEYAPIDKDLKLITIGGEYYYNDLTLSGEWAKRYTDSLIATSRVYYLAASYNLTDKITPYVYYSRMKYIQKTDPRIEAEPSNLIEAIKLSQLKAALDDISALNGNDDSSQSRCIGIKYSVSDSISAKLEMIHIKDANYESDYRMYHLSMDFFF